jgi:cytochrome P450
MGTSDKIWENPDKFIPERFEAHNLEGRNPCSFIVFGAGPRNCESNKI